MTDTATINLPAATAVDALLGNKTSDGINDVVRISIADFVAQIISSPTQATFGTKAEAQAENIPSDVRTIFLLGYWAEGDGGRAMYVRAASEPSQPGKMQTADGSWWLLAELRPNIKQFGARADFLAVDGVVSIVTGTAALQVVGAEFGSGDVGKLICVPGAGAGGADLSTTIAAVANSENVTLGVNASTTLTSAATSIYYATDDRASIQSAINSAEAQGGGVVVFPAFRCGVSGTVVCDESFVRLEGQGQYRGGVIGFHAVGHIVHFDGTSSVLIGNEFTGLYVDSVVTKTSGAALCFEAATRFQVTNYRLAGQDGFGGQNAPKLWDGLDLDKVDRVDVDIFQINCQNDSIIANGSTPGGSLPRGSDIYLDQGKIIGEGVGIRCAGDVGGLKLGAVSLNNCDAACIVFDQSRVASGNRQTFISSQCDIDGESVGGVRQQPGIVINDPEMEDLHADGVWFSVLTHALDIQSCSSTKTKIKLTGGRIAQCDGDGIRIGAIPALLLVNGVEFSDIVGWAVNATVDCTNLGNGRGVFIFPTCTFYNCLAGDVTWENTGMMPGTSISRAIANNEVFAFKPRDLTTLGSSGLVHVDRANSSHHVFAYYRAESGGAVVSPIQLVGDITASNGLLTNGTTDGVVDDINVFAHTDEKIRVKNRLGVQVTVMISLLSAHPGANLQSGP